MSVDKKQENLVRFVNSRIPFYGPEDIIKLEEIYNKYYEQGRAAFNPDSYKGLINFDHNGCPDGTACGIPFFFGYNLAAEVYFNEKYKILEFQEKLKSLCSEYNIELHGDYDGFVYIQTPENYQVDVTL